MDFEKQTSEIMDMNNIPIDTWIELCVLYKIVMITKNTFVIVYNEESLKEHKEALILELLGFDLDNEKGDEWIPEEEEVEYDTSYHIQAVEKLNKYIPDDDYPDVPDNWWKKMEEEDTFGEQMREYRINVSVGHPY